MEKIFSKVDPNQLLHIVFRRGNLNSSRIEIVPETEFIQCAALNMESGCNFRPHKHIFKKRTENKIAQESWVVIQGSVRCIFYDTDNTIIAKPILRSGDASFTLYGGHTYEVLEDNTFVYEFKTGPYEGQKFDKEFIE
jgi:cupin fold WbuC family metalloprotein